MDIAGFYGKYIDLSKAKHVGKKEVSVNCVFHSDTKPSLSINLNNGLWKCHSACCPSNSEGHGGGDMAKFLAQLKGISAFEARDIVKSDMGGSVEKRSRRSAPVSKKPEKEMPIKEDDILNAKLALLSNAERLDFLKKVRLFTDETIARFELGFDKGRYWIPVRENGVLINVRRYAPGSSSKTINVSGHGDARLWPMDNLDQDVIYLMEGETDCILANQLGFNAVTVTAGASTFNTDWLPLFRDKIVYVCYDIDEAGIKGAHRVCNLIASVAETCYNVQLPITEPANGDFTDYIKTGAKASDFREVCAKAPVVLPQAEYNKVVPDEVYDTFLIEASYNKDLIKKRVRMKVCIMGRQQKLFNVPKKFKLSCTNDFGQNCSRCNMDGCTNGISFTTREDDPDLLLFIECHSDILMNLLKKRIGVPGKCPRFKIDKSEQSFIEEVFTIPTIDSGSDYIMRSMYAFGLELKLSTDYVVEVVTINHPKTQELIHIIYKAEPSSSSIDEFKMTNELKESLKVFQCQSVKN